MNNNWTRELLNKLYWEDSLSLRLIARQFNCSKSAVTWALRKFNIPIRKPKEALIVRDQTGRGRLVNGSNNPMWRGGRSQTSSGHIRIWTPNHPKATKRGTVLEHILVWERVTGKSLPDNWVIHHLNGIPNDNRPKNLLAMPRKCHRHNLLVKGLRRRIRALEKEKRNSQNALLG